MTKFGAYVGNDASDLAAYESWLGRPVDNVLSFFNQSSWKAFDDSIDYGLNIWAGAAAPVIWSVPLTVEGTSLSQAAGGAYDAHFQKAAAAIAESRTDTGPIYIRLGWEFNGDWMPWSAGGHEADFIAAFRHVAQIFDGVSDRFKIVWDVNIGGGNIDPATAYPGDDYVDVVGLDLYYNTTWDSADSNKAFAYSVSRPYGLQWVADFAAAHDKPGAISEWGVQSNGAGPFTKDLAGWMDQHGMLFANYWESNAGAFPGELRQGAYPDAAAEFRDTFGNGAKHDTIVLQVSADSYGGDPQFVVTIDGKQIGGVQTAHAAHAAGLSDTITLQSDFGSDPQSVAITFLNDGWGGSADLDRNLYVEHLTLNGRDFAGSEAINKAGINAGGVAMLAVNGSATFDLHPKAQPDTLVLRVSADSYLGDPQFSVMVDGRQVGGILTTHAAHAGGAYDMITLQGDFGSDPQAVAVTFLNDAWGGRAGLDRNLYVEKVSLNGHDAPLGDAVNPAGTVSGSEVALNTGGTASFSLAQHGDTLVFRVSADSYAGDPQFTVVVDGRQVGGILTTHASHTEGASDMITLHGDFGSDPQAIAVTFLNDGWGGRPDLDRNLYVEKVVLNGRDIAIGDAANAAGTVSTHEVALNTQGTAIFSLAEHSDTLVLKVSADAYLGDPQFTVAVDGKQVGGTMTAHASHAEGAFDTITLRGEFGADPQSVAVTFLNDDWGGRPDLDRNLYVEQVALDGHVLAGGHSATGAAALYANGTATFHLPHVDDLLM